MKIRCVMAAALAVCAVGSLAQATTESYDQVNMRFNGVGSGRAVGVQFWVGSTKVLDSNVFAGSLNHDFSTGAQVGVAAVDENSSGNVLNGRTIGTFCTDILEHVDSRWRTNNLTNVTQAPTTQSIANTAMGLDKSGRLAQLYNFGQGAGLINGAGGWADASGSPTSRDKAAAWQLLVWEIVFGDANDSNWDTNGALRVSGLTSQVRNFFGQFRDLSSSSSSDLAGFRASSRAGSQDQLVIIPLPPALYAGAGMLGLVMGAKFMRRRQARLA
jgi:hypothetical protein